MSQSITIVGSSARAAADSAARAGWIVVAADLFCDRDLHRVATATRTADYPAGLARTIRGPQAGGWMYLGALENDPALLDAWARDRPLWGNDGRTVRAVRDPEALMRVLRQAGLHAPEARRTSAGLATDGSWLCKPLHSAGGAQVQRWYGKRGGEHARHCYFQQHIAGDPCAAVYLGAAGRAVLWGVTRQWIGRDWTGAEGYRYCGSIGPLALSEQRTSQFMAIGDALARAFELQGLFGVDAVVNPQGVWPVEVNPRYTASVEVLERSSGLNAIAAHVAACTAQSLPIPPAAVTKFTGKAILFARKSLMVGDALESIISRELASLQPRLADLPRRGETIERGWPILTLLETGDNLQQLTEALRCRAAQLSELLHD